jgi:Transcription initiation factor IIB (TFIIB)
MSDSTPRSSPTVRQRETESETESADETTHCPECSGQLITDEEHGETVCRECGLVVESDAVDRGPSGAPSTARNAIRNPVSARRRRT